MRIARKLWSLTSKFVIVAGISYAAAQNGIGIDHAQDSQPENFPTYETHSDAARPLCFVETGEWDVVKAGPSIVAGHVIVVKLNGSMVRMDTSEAFDRFESNTYADDIWVVGVCKGDVL